MEVTWVKNGYGENEFFDYMNVNLDKVISNPHILGVYIIGEKLFVEGHNLPSCIYIGSGKILERLKQHKEEEKLMKYNPLYITWAEVPKDKMKGVERFLIDNLEPIACERAPDDEPIEVNVPWYPNRDWYKYLH